MANFDDDHHPLADAAIGQLATALAPVEPAPERKAALRDRLLARAAAERDGPGLVTIRKAADGWIEPLPGVRVKLLQAEGDAGAESYLIRLDAGARAPAHGHPGPEECVVLEGSVRYVGGATLNAGDYQLAKVGAEHTELVSDTGALVFIRYAKPLSHYVQV